MTVLLDKQHILKAYGEAVLKDLDPLEYLVKEQLKRVIEEVKKYPEVCIAIRETGFWQSLLDEVS